MKGLHFRLVTCVIILWLYGCKTAQKTKTTQPQIDSTLLESIPETIPLDTIPEETPVSDSLFEEQINELPDSLVFIGVGDIMLGTNFPGPEYLPEDSGKHLLSNVREILQSADVTFGNFEGVSLNEGGVPKNCNNPQACYLFRSPTYLAANLKDCGFDLLSVANNHAGDFGDTGRQSTGNTLDSLGISYAGFISKPYDVIEINGLKIGFTAFSPNSGTNSIHDLDFAKEIIHLLDSISDIILVSIHSGAEGAAYQHVTRENEIFYGEDRGNVYQFAHELIDAGADIIFGHGPHVSRAIELYKGRFIAYSLGNFCTYARFNLRGPNGVAPIMQIVTNSEGEFLKGSIIPVRQIGLGYPVIDETGEVIKIIRELSEKDIPESRLSIGDSGLITYIQNP